MISEYNINLSMAREGDINELNLLDKLGIIPGKNENSSEFIARILHIQNEVTTLNESISNNSIVSVDNIKIDGKSTIPEEHFKKAAEYLKRYEFSIKWMPAFYTSRYLPPLCGGCSLTTDTGLAFFILKSVFSVKEKWLIYNRSELIAHELCHIARMPIEGNMFEELFAYNISHSKIRRYLGSCFQSGREQLYLIIPILILLFAQIAQNTILPDINLVYFVFFALLCPIWLLIRNYRIRRKYSKAKLNLESCFPEKKLNTDAILFRCTENEIISISIRKNAKKLREWIDLQSTTNLRWKIINSRFL